FAGFCNRIAEVLDDPGVDIIESGNVGEVRSSVQWVIFPITTGDNCTRGALWRCTHGRNALSNQVCPAAYFVNLWIQHFVNRNELWSHNIPVCVFERQMEIVERVETHLENICYSVAVFCFHAWN